MSTHLRVNPILCDGFGQCAELLPELIELDEWGYPIVSGARVPAALDAEVRQAIALCPRLALTVEERRAARSIGAVR